MYPIFQTNNFSAYTLSIKTHSFPSSKSQLNNTSISLFNQNPSILRRISKSPNPKSSRYTRRGNRSKLIRWQRSILNHMYLLRRISLNRLQWSPSSISLFINQTIFLWLNRKGPGLSIYIFPTVNCKSFIRLYTMLLIHPRFRTQPRPTIKLLHGPNFSKCVIESPGLFENIIMLGLNFLDSLWLNWLQLEFHRNWGAFEDTPGKRLEFRLRLKFFTIALEFFHKTT